MIFQVLIMFTDNVYAPDETGLSTGLTPICKLVQDDTPAYDDIKGYFLSSCS